MNYLPYFSELNLDGYALVCILAGVVISWLGCYLRTYGADE